MGHSKAPNPANICITLHSISSWNSKVRIMGDRICMGGIHTLLIIKPFGTWTCMDIVRRQILPTFALPFIAYHHGILRSGSWGSHMYGRYPYSFLIIKPFGTWTCMDIVRRQILPTFALPFIAYHHGILRSGSWGSHMYGRYPYSFLIMSLSALGHVWT
ncbi:hypothetical protein CEXT_528671 [Caerostris extrusa]|uniref:Uncharacterized protein n=1 Tax=Caerostris extrusa TaxID=172846 RepID=A0AAV4V8J8_CAEEX|nr:hypothetical protein CEXT_528671 [Caerostris extrusa]